MSKRSPWCKTHEREEKKSDDPSQEDATEETSPAKTRQDALVLFNRGTGLAVAEDDLSGPGKLGDVSAALSDIASEGSGTPDEDATQGQEDPAVFAADWAEDCEPESHSAAPVCALAHPFPKEAFSVCEEEAIRGHFRHYWREKAAEIPVNKDWVSSSRECLRDYRRQLDRLGELLSLVLGERQTPSSPEVLLRREAVRVALSSRPLPDVFARKKKLAPPSTDGLGGLQAAHGEEIAFTNRLGPDFVLREAVRATQELAQSAEKMSEIRRPRGRQKSQPARQELVARLLTVRRKAFAGNRGRHVKACELLKGLPPKVAKLYIPCISGSAMRECRAWDDPSRPGVPRWSTREVALRRWFLRQIVDGNHIRDAFLTTEEVALLLVAAGIAQDPAGGTSEGRDAEVVARDMVLYDLSVLRGAAEKKSRKRRKDG